MSLTISGYLRRESGSFTILLARDLSPSAIVRIATKRGSDSSISSSSEETEGAGLEEMLEEEAEVMDVEGLEEMLLPILEMEAG